MSQDFWNQRYATSEYVYGTEPNDFLRAHAAQLPSGNILCLADGEGRNGVYLASLGYSVTSVDFSLEGLKKGRALAQNQGVKVNFVHADLTDYAITPQTYSGVVSIFAHFPPALRQSLYPRAAAGLKPGGVLIFESYGPDQLAYNTGGPRDLALLPGAAQLTQEWLGLSWLHQKELIREVHEGVFHGGTSAVVQLIGQKPSA